MNLKEAKEYLQTNGFTVRQLNECSSSPGCGGGGFGGCGFRPSRRRNSCSSHFEAEIPIRPARMNTSNLNTNANILDLLAKIPASKRQLIIQLLKALIAE